MRTIETQTPINPSRAKEGTRTNLRIKQTKTE